MTRYTMPGRSQGKAFMQRAIARLERDDVHRWVFAHNLAPEVEYAVRSTSLARTHIVLNNTPPLHAMARNDEAVDVNPHLSVCGWPFCLGDLDGVDDAHTGGGAA